MGAVRSGVRNNVGLILVLIVQIACAVFFVSEIVISVFGLRASPISWQLLEFIELGAALGLMIGVILGAVLLSQSRRRTAKAEQALRAARSAFASVLDERFESWGLTPAERDVALFAIKGLSTAEIAGLRDVSEGTVKAQTAAIYRKAGVSGRPQLLSSFIDDLLVGDGARA